MFASLARGLAALRVAAPSTPLARSFAHSSVPGRTGALAIKAGMMSEFDNWGNRQVLTVLIVNGCTVTQVKHAADHGYTALQLGVADAKLKNVTKPLKGHFAKAGVKPKRKLMEFRVKPEALLPVGTVISAAHFVPGQLVDVCGTTKGKGFQGGMKRHHFGGMRASHGVSVVHRALGSTGACQDPGRVWKGKKMAGHMGVDRRTTLNLEVFKVDAAKGLVYVKGCVPGNAGNFVRLRDAVKGPKSPSALPFPTAKAGAEGAAAVVYAPLPKEDPNKPLDL